MVNKMTSRTISHELIDWLLTEGQPWVRYRTLTDLLDKPENDPGVAAARKAVVDHPQIRELIEVASHWPEPALKRHNDAKHPLHVLTALSDFGVHADDDGLDSVLKKMLLHQSPEGAFQIQVNISPSHGCTGSDQWAWMLCDAPTTLYTLLSFGLSEHPAVKKAVEHLATLLRDNGWPCVASPELGKFRGPGRKEDFCPYATLVSLRALSLLPDMIDNDIGRTGAQALLWHWEAQKERKVYLFGIGGDFRKLKYPFVWYDILHVTEVLSRYPHVYEDPRLGQMVDEMLDQADEKGRYTARSAYRAWDGWEFADKKRPSPWITFLVLRIGKRVGRLRVGTPERLA